MTLIKIAYCFIIIITNFKVRYNKLKKLKNVFHISKSDRHFEIITLLASK